MAEAFADKLNNLFHSSCTAIALAMGAEVGLFKAMSDLNRPFSSDELARTAGCKERYVREWLGIMACADIVAFDAGTEKFSVGEERLSCLTGVVPVAMGAVCVFGQRHPILKECFKLDGPDGMDQSITPALGRWLDSVRGGSFKSVIDIDILGQVPDMKKKLESGITVADVGCGVGMLGMMIAERFPNSTFWAIDIDKELLKTGHQRAKAKNLENIHFEYGDVHKLSEKWAAKFDYVVTYDVIHDMPYPRVALQEIYKCLKDGGVLSMFEPKVHSSLADNLNADHSSETYMFSLFVCLPHSLSAPNGEGWGRTMGEERGREFVKQAGFVDFQVIHGNMNHFVCNK